MARGTAADNPQQGASADRDQQASGEALSRLPAERQAEMMNNAVQTRGAARIRMVRLAASRSVKIFCGHSVLVQRNRRAHSLIATARPWDGRSAKARWYRLWT